MTAELPPLEATDLYVYAHGNGALFLADAEHSGFVTLDEVLALAGAARRVFLAGDVGTAIADEAMAAVKARAGEVVRWPAIPPWEWHDGADALMVAAAAGQDDLLDDLLARGAEVNSRNHDGATPLHHAAAHGNLHAIDRLLAAGAQLDARNDAGLTALMAAQACGEVAAAMRLEAAGATPSHEAAEPATFRWSHRLPIIGWTATGLVIGGYLDFFTGQDYGLAVGAATFLVLTAILLRVAAGSRSAWRSVVPKRFDGRRLHGSSLFGRSVEVDLDAVSAAAYAPGAGGRAGRVVGTKLLLVHPDGRAFPRKDLGKAMQRDELDALAPGDGPITGTIVLLDPWWEHEVLRPLGTRLISDPVLLTPRLRERLRMARREDPEVSVNAQNRAALRQARRRRSSKQAEPD